MFRIGIGNDTHRLVDGRPLVLGGVQIPSTRGAEGHSDADALTHAIADAILGALCEGDLGVHFNDRDPQWKNADSLQLLSRINSLADERGFHIINIDSNIIIERPRLRDHVNTMRAKLAETLGIEIGCVSVKAKSGEGLGPVGRGEAVETQAVVLLASVSNSFAD